MSEVPFITETTQIRRALDLINKIDNSKFRLLLQRILQKIHLKNENYFNDDELDKLEKSFELCNDDLNLIINTVEFVYLQSAYVLIKPTQLVNNLGKLNLDSDKIELIAGLWADNSKDIIEKLRETRTISYKKLQGLKWRLNLQMGTNFKSKTKLTKTLVDFNIEQNENENENLVVEFTKDELFEFYLKLEDIQRQLDNLNK